jgi:hypothetical protein
LKECEDTHLGEEVDRNWNEVVTQQYLFDRLAHEVMVSQTKKAFDCTFNSKVQTVEEKPRPCVLVCLVFQVTVVSPW